MQKCRFWKTQTRRDISIQSEVWILIDCAWNQQRNFLVSENHRESCAQRWRDLNRRKRNLADDVRISEAKNAFDLIERDTFGNSDNVLIVVGTLSTRNKDEMLDEISQFNCIDHNSPHVRHAREDEGFGRIKAECDKILHIFQSKSR